MSDAERLEALIARCEAIPDAGLRGDMIELLQRILALHARGLRQMLQAAADAPRLEALWAAWERDGEVRGLLELHELRPERPAAAAGNFVPVTVLTGGGGHVVAEPTAG
ncbi:MAG: hypothetical protein ACTHJX_07730 [Terriglobales bacterium]